MATRIEIYNSDYGYANPEYKPNNLFVFINTRFEATFATDYVEGDDLVVLEKILVDNLIAALKPSETGFVHSITLRGVGELTVSECTLLIKHLQDEVEVIQNEKLRG